MPRVAELFESLADGRAALREAIARYEDNNWESPILEAESSQKGWQDTGKWTPRQAAEHAVSAQPGYFAYLRVCLDQGDPPSLVEFAYSGAFGEINEYHRAPKSVSFPSPADSLIALDSDAEEAQRLSQSLEDSDLDRYAGINDVHIDYLETLGYPAAKTVEGLLNALIAHTFDHAEQLAKALDQHQTGEE